jgi:hypothetical protein
MPSPVVVDALLYGSSAAFALRMVSASSMLRNRLWAELAWPVYAAAAVAGVVLAGLGLWLGGTHLLRVRVALASVVFVGAVVVPLAVEVQWRAEPQRAPARALHPFGASEVVVTEAAASTVLRGHDPYAVQLRSPELAGRTPGTGEHFPYLPGMIAFGLPRALLPHSPWTDARLFFLAVTTGAAALMLVARRRGPPELSLRALQVLMVLPTGAAAIVTGGDDLPVLALCLLALVLFDGGRHVASSWAAAGAAVLKLTAWPVLVALAVARKRPSRLPVAAVGVVVGAAIVAGPAVFADDVLLFPGALTKLASPAKTTTVGGLLIGKANASSSWRIAMTVVLVVLAAVVAGVVLRVLASQRDVGASETAAAAGVVLLGLIVLAPIARAGYLAYPVDLLAWAVLLRRSPSKPPRREAPAW